MHKSFSQVDDGKSHLETHSGENIWSCDQCNKSFGIFLLDGMGKGKNKGWTLMAGIGLTQISGAIIVKINFNDIMKQGRS